MYNRLKIYDVKQVTSFDSYVVVFGWNKTLTVHAVLLRYFVGKTYTINMSIHGSGSPEGHNGTLDG